MPFLELSLTLHAAEQERVERALEDAGALSITLLDAEADTPNERAILEPGVGETPLWGEVVLSALFDAEADRSGLLHVLAEWLPDIDPAQVRFAEVDLVVRHLRRVHGDEQRIAVGFELGALVRAVRVLDRERVQAELLLQLFEQIFVGFVQAHPDEHLGIFQRRIDLVQRDRAWRAIAIGNAVDQHRRGGSFGRGGAGRHARMMPERMGRSNG